MNLDSLLNGMNLTLAGAIWGILYGLKRAYPDVAASHWGQRATPLLPLLLGAAGGLVGAVTVAPVTLANKIVAGLMVGGLSMVVFKIGKTTVMGKDVPAPDGAADKGE